MHYLIKFIFFVLLSYNSFANENKSNQILFKINNKVFTNIDLEERKEYVSIIKNIKQSEFSDLENKEILNDYVSSLIFYEYYIINKIVFKNLNEEIDTILKKRLQDSVSLNQIDIENLKLNTKMDIVRNKIIEEKLNSEKNKLLKEVNTLDLIYNYNLQYLIINENLIEKELIKNIEDRKEFNNLKDFLIKNKIKFFNKEEDINDNSTISKRIKKIIDQNIEIYSYNENGYINLISIVKNLESYEGIYVKLVNFKSLTPFEKNNLQCDKLNQTTDINKTIFKEYEYSKLNNNIKSKLRSINDYIVISDENQFNYIVLCDLNYDENILRNINFNKNVNSLVSKIQRNFLKKYKNEYKFTKIK